MPREDMKILIVYLRIQIVYICTMRRYSQTSYDKTEGIIRDGLLHKIYRRYFTEGLKS